MKILYLPFILNISPESHGDYQSDTIGHGLRSLFGNDFVEVPRHWWWYSSEKNKNPAIFKKMWGKGFSTYGLLPDEAVDRDDIVPKIEHHYYDLIICPIHHSVGGHPYAKQIISENLRNLSYYFPANKIAVIDGHDTTEIFIDNPRAKCVYFKRELTIPTEGVYPIGFSIPAEKIVTDIPRKTKDFAWIVPGMHSNNSAHIKSYIYNDEESYYQDYRESYFAYTCCKAGWDSMRTLEILANGCIPYFTDIENCPKNCLSFHPKHLYYIGKKMHGVHPGWVGKDRVGSTEIIKPGIDRGVINFSEFSLSDYEELCSELLEFTRKNLTTVAMATYLIEKIKEHG